LWVVTPCTEDGGSKVLRNNGIVNTSLQGVTTLKTTTWIGQFLHSLYRNTESW